MDGGNDYLIQVKGNRKNLFETVKDYTTQCEHISEYLKTEKNKGREENRLVKVYKPRVDDPEIRKWKKLNYILMLTSSGIRAGKEYNHNHYYITSRTEQSAQYYADKIRGHWGIENKSHWVKDVIMNEDSSGIKNLARSTIMSSVRCLIQNIYRLNNYPSIKYAIEKHQNNLVASIKLII